MSENTPAPVLPEKMVRYAPDEFLARWDEETEAYKAAHCRLWKIEYIEGYGVLSKELTEALTAEEAARRGFPFPDVLAQLQADALVKVAQLEAQVAEAERTAASAAEAHAAEVAAKDANMQQALAALDALNAKAVEAEAKAADLEAKLAEAQSPFVTIATAIKGLFTKAA